MSKLTNDNGKFKNKHQEIMDKLNLGEMKELILAYVIKEFVDNGDAEITYDTPLISGGMLIPFQWFHCFLFLRIDSK